MNRKAHVACNFDCLFKTEGLLKVARSELLRKCDSISETVQDGVVITTDH